ncbi:MAG TPA: uracil-DNA glycosylase family protein [Chthoniobacterales bacterium]
MPDSLEKLVRELRQCAACPKMHRPAVSGGAVRSRVISVGQAPGTREPVAGKPFAWTAGKTLFRWFETFCGIDEAEYRRTVYMAAVCRCFPGKTKAGGDRVPDPDEITECSRWLKREFDLLSPALIIPIGKLAISQFLPVLPLTETIGHQFPIKYYGHAIDVIPLPHPSGASPWHRIEPGKSLLEQAMKRIANHPAWRERNLKS